MRKYLFAGLVFFMCFFTSCGVMRNVSPTIVDYNKMLFSNGENTTLLSRYDIHDTIATDSVGCGFSLLYGVVFARDALNEIYGELNNEKFRLFDNCLDWPHIIIPSLGLDLQAIDGSYRVIIPSGTYDIVVFADGYYPVHFKWNFIDQHIYTINFYMGCTVIH